MDSPALLVVCRLLVAAVFAVAGIAKLRDPAGSRQTFADFGVPARLTPGLAVALPALEILVAAALVPSATVTFGAGLALALLVVFIIGIGRSLIRGHRPSCHCFGQLRSGPVGPGVLVRNAVLATLALLVLIASWRDPAPSLVAWLVPLSGFERALVAGGVAGLALLSAQVALLVTLTAQNERILGRLGAPGPQATASRAPMPVTSASLAVGSPAPAFSLPALDGPDMTLDALVAGGKPVVLMFANPGCGPCAALFPRIVEWQQNYRDSLVFAVVSRGTPEANRATMPEQRMTVLLQGDREVAGLFGVTSTPAAVLVRNDGTIGSAPAQGDAQITTLVERAAGLALETPRPLDESRQPLAGPSDDRPKSHVPDFALPDVDGQIVRLSALRPSTVLLFWNPGCGFCKRILSEIKAWDARPLTDRPPLLVVSSGTPEDNRALGLTSPIVLDAGFSIGRQLDIRGTPSAVLLGDGGSLAGEPVTGAPQVLELLAGLMATALPMQTRFARHDAVEDELLPDGGMMLYNPTTRQVLTLNGTAALVWEGCDGERSLESMVAEVRDVFPSATDAERDVRQLVDRLLRVGMISTATTSDLKGSLPSPTIAAATTTHG